MYEVGDSFEGEIIGNTLRAFNDKVAAVIKIEPPDGSDPIEAMIFLTEASKNMAHAQLKLCGFDTKAIPIEVLLKQPMFLVGRKVKVDVDEYNGKKQYRIPTADAPSAKAIASVQSLFGKPSPVAKTAATSSEPAPIADDDIPF